MRYTLDSTLFCLRAARLLNRRKWDSIVDFGKPMHELRLRCPTDPLKKSSRKMAHRESEASRVKDGSNSRK